MLGVLSLPAHPRPASLLLSGRGGESEEHRQGLRHEDPQQVGNAETSRGESRGGWVENQGDCG